MALVNCPECGRQISTKAAVCIGCGAPLKETIERASSGSLFVDERTIRNGEGSGNRHSQMIALIGSAVLLLGVFAPLVSLPFVGSLNYFQNGRGDGVIVFLLGVVSALFALRRTFRVLWYTASGSTAVVVFTFANLTLRTIEVAEDLRNKLEGNPFSALGEMAIASTQFQWGWAVLVLGIAMLFIAAQLEDPLFRKRSVTSSVIARTDGNKADAGSPALSASMFAADSGATRGWRLFLAVLGLLIVGYVSVTAYQWWVTGKLDSVADRTDLPQKERPPIEVQVDASSTLPAPKALDATVRMRQTAQDRERAGRVDGSTARAKISREGNSAKRVEPSVPPTPNSVPSPMIESATPLAVPAAPEPPLPDVKQPIRVGGNVGVPTKVKDVRPVYPPIAQSARVQGIVIIDATIGPDGAVKDAKVLRSIPLLDQAALDAVRQWVFTPTLLNGVPVPVVMTVTVQFSLQ